MNNEKLTAKLREISRGTASTYKKQIFRQAARRIEDQAELLKKVKRLLTHLRSRLPAMDSGCSLCDHVGIPKPCYEQQDLNCSDCPEGCNCKECGPEGSKWENGLLKEILEGLGCGETSKGGG